ncbi:PAS domain-containing sensor histidine kinase [Rhodoferax sp. PAMC 29310]|uniref:sensor histidine kinase n=1 Tax=Rhodoferax sp. PAMC 29310 TaxID=2822760 RepID=UPI001F0AF586|nr:ATP-binding protein [Rhodoferax sp. PAMC 29310]
MKQPPDAAPSWFGPNLFEPGIEQADRPDEFNRIWHGFMTARVTLGLVLVLLQSVFFALSSTKDLGPLLICATYFIAALVVRLMVRPRPMGKTFDAQWFGTVGVDVVAFALLQMSQDTSINYAPLFALPVLMTSILGSMLLAMGAAASVTLFLFLYAGWVVLHGAGDAAPHFLQAALTGAGCFALSFLANQFATRMAHVELRAERNQLAADVQRQVNELVVESLSDGIMVIDRTGTVRSANPAARRLLGPERFLDAEFFNLRSKPGWQSLVALMKLSFDKLTSQQAEVILRHSGQGPRRLRAQTQMTSINNANDALCVLFLQDQREMEARVRTEKLASMGRMSAAVAHEIRNPLAAIAQANALLDEDLTEPGHKQLSQMVQQNARRLERIVDEVLDIARTHHEEQGVADAIRLNELVMQTCRDWQAQTGSKNLLCLSQAEGATEVRFEPEHLRRVLINLLDNARRYASQNPNAIQVSVGQNPGGRAFVSVWSDGQPMDKSVERHLFEPFFSSESRSSGLGLYICRELCERHGATIIHQRNTGHGNDSPVDGNEFLVSFHGFVTREGGPALSQKDSPQP